MIQQQQQGMPAAAQAFENEQAPNPMHTRPELTLVSPSEESIAAQICNAQQPVIVMGEQAAKSYGQILKYFSDVFDGVPIIFETADAQQAFKSASGGYLPSSTLDHKMKSRDRMGQYESVLRNSDCIVVLGKISNTSKELITACDSAARKTIYSAMATESGNMPCVNFAIIDKADKGCSPEWLSRARKMKPSAF
jgi:hypothetical protein